jgi:8-oxo-(d)GTP phosphatase
VNVFINDIPLIIKNATEKVRRRRFDLILEPGAVFTSKDLVGHVMVQDADDAIIDRLTRLMEVKKLKKLASLTLLAIQKKLLIQHLKDQFKIVKAGGGLVVKDNRLLLIYRLGMWDLPKGKLKKDEDVAEGALREVEEECNIHVSVVTRLPATWHSYAFKGTKILKKTDWFLMACHDDSSMRPQVEEDIQEVRWCTPDEALDLLPKSYASVAFIIRHYLERVGNLAGE